MNNIARSLTTATSSSRFTQANYWRDPASGVAYQVQVEYPQFQVDRPEDIEMIPVANSADGKVYLRDVASWNRITTPAEYDRINQQRFMFLNRMWATYL